MKKFIRSSMQGQSLVEFAIIFPVFVLMAVMVFDLGRVVYYSSTIHNAAREAARNGIVNPDNNNPTIESTAVKKAIGLDLVEGTNVSVCWHYDPDHILDFPPPSVRVTVTYDFSPVTPLVSHFLPGGEIHLTGEAVMKLEKLPTTTPICLY